MLVSFGIPHYINNFVIPYVASPLIILPESVKWLISSLVKQKRVRLLYACSIMRLLDSSIAQGLTGHGCLISYLYQYKAFDLFMPS
jgi:hypothetical protein